MYNEDPLLALWDLPWCRLLGCQTDKAALMPQKADFATPIPNDPRFHPWLGSYHIIKSG